MEWPLLHVGEPDFVALLEISQQYAFQLSRSLRVLGEHAPPIRARICESLGFLGIKLNDKHNAANEDTISAETSRVSVRVFRTDEELMIARSVLPFLKLGAVNKKN